ncbi:hypothetical protein R3P38DRAFT_2768681 [Favolaschia claudopus]|uniref:Uncharacterized protein n=1 Tax=Favolaschia claudopus TaxID=2862362 RepID=A0AAW0CND8_9AGAR
MLPDFDPFSSDPNSESYIPEPDVPYRFGLGHPTLKSHMFVTPSARRRDLRPAQRGMQRKSSRVCSPGGNTSQSSRSSPLNQTTGSSGNLEGILMLDAWTDRLSRITEDDELYPYPNPLALIQMASSSQSK